MAETGLFLFCFVFFFFQQKTKKSQENGDVVSIPNELSLDSMDNVETVFLTHPMHHNYCLTCWLSKRNITAQKVDVFFRFVFPFLFAVFNAAYWSFYMQNRRKGEEAWTE